MARYPTYCIGPDRYKVQPPLGVDLRWRGLHGQARPSGLDPAPGIEGTVDPIGEGVSFRIGLARQPLQVQAGIPRSRLF